MPALENVFSWSKSRAEEFDECRRKYYYDRYASWGGWDASAPKEARLAYILKNLKNRWAWKGETVHHVIEMFLKAARSGREMNEAEALELLTKTMRENYLSSKAKKYLKDPKRSVGLFEHEYEKPVTDAVWKAVHDESAACLRNFLDSDLCRELASDDKKSWLLVEDLEEFDFDGSKIYVKLDFARRRGGSVEIFDWKTGKEEKAPGVQIGAYAIYAMQKWGVGLDKVRAYRVYLSNPNPAPSEQTLTDALIDETRETITKSIASMRALLSDPARNVPMDRAEFPFTENARLCGNCNFYKMCEKYS